MQRMTPALQRPLLALALIGGLSLGACGVFPVYTTEWLPVPGQTQTNQEAALAICKPIAEAERSRAELESDWPLIQGTPDDPYYDPGAISDRSNAVAKGALTACMADRGWYPKRICVDNC